MENKADTHPDVVQFRGGVNCSLLAGPFTLPLAFAVNMLRKLDDLELRDVPRELFDGLEKIEYL